MQAIKFSFKGKRNIKKNPVKLGEGGIYLTNTNQNLKQHKKTHEKITPLINDCRECNKTFPTKKSLSDHMRTHNKKDKSINCELCEFKTDRKFNLKQHLKVESSFPELSRVSELPVSPKKKTGDEQ